MFENACDLEIAQNSNCLVYRDHMFFPWDGSLFQLSNPEIAQFELKLSYLRIWELKKVSHLRKKARDQYFKLKLSYLRIWELKKVSHLREKTCDHEKLDSLNFELSQDHMLIQTCDIGSFDDFLSYLRVPPVLVTDLAHIMWVTKYVGD